jgi:hypothetical protein
MITAGMSLTIGEMFYILRRRAELSTGELAERAEVEEKVVNAIEENVAEEMLIGDMIAVSSALGVYLHISLSQREIPLIVPVLEDQLVLED